MGKVSAVTKLKKYHHTLGMQGLLTALMAKALKKQIELRVESPGIQFPFHLRIPSSDEAAYKKVFIYSECDVAVKTPPKTIIDAGANTGLVSIYYANQFPDAKIVAIEPEKSNFKILKRNTGSYENIHTVQAALWHENTEIDLVDPGLGKWGFMTMAGNRADTEQKTRHSVQALTVDEIIKMFSLGTIDIFKMDIEGAEREVFQTSSSWIQGVEAMIVELHEHLKPGCNRSFYNATNDFAHEWTDGENIFLSKKTSCLVAP